MGLFLTLFFTVWAVALASFFVVSRLFRSADIERTRNRLLGKEKKQKARTGPVALFSSEQKAIGDLLPRLMKKLNLTGRLRALLEQAGLKWNPVRFAQAVLAAFLGAFWLSWLLLPYAFRWWAFLAGTVGAVIPVMYVVRARTKRLGAFEAIFPDVLEFISRSMRAGHAFSVSLEMIYREFAEPVSGEFRRTFEEHNLGLPLDTALQALGKRIPMLDVQFFVSAVLLQKRTGGNLAEILDKLAYVIRERFKLRGRIKAISAHRRLTGLSLTCIPIGVGVLMFFANPEYVEFFFKDETGNIMLGGAIGFQILGYAIIKKIVSIEV